MSLLSGVTLTGSRRDPRRLRGPPDARRVRPPLPAVPPARGPRGGGAPRSRGAGPGSGWTREASSTTRGSLRRAAASPALALPLRVVLKRLAVEEARCRDRRGEGAALAEWRGPRSPRPSSSAEGRAGIRGSARSRPSLAAPPLPAGRAAPLASEETVLSPIRARVGGRQGHRRCDGPPGGASATSRTSR